MAHARKLQDRRSKSTDSKAWDLSVQINVTVILAALHTRLRESLLLLLFCEAIVS